MPEATTLLGGECVRSGTRWTNVAIWPSPPSLWLPRQTDRLHHPYGYPGRPGRPSPPRENPGCQSPIGPYCRPPPIPPRVTPMAGPHLLRPEQPLLPIAQSRSPLYSAQRQTPLYSAQRKSPLYSAQSTPLSYSGTRRKH